MGLINYKVEDFRNFKQFIDENKNVIIIPRKDS